MAGLVQNRSIPTLLAVQMAAVIRGQVHECSCGHKGFAVSPKIWGQA